MRKNILSVHFPPVKIFRD